MTQKRLCDADLAVEMAIRAELIAIDNRAVEHSRENAIRMLLSDLPYACACCPKLVVAEQMYEDVRTLQHRLQLRVGCRAAPDDVCHDRYDIKSGAWIKEIQKVVERNEWDANGRIYATAGYETVSMDVSAQPLRPEFGMTAAVAVSEGYSLREFAEKVGDRISISEWNSQKSIKRMASEIVYERPNPDKPKTEGFDDAW